MNELNLLEAHLQGRLEGYKAGSIYCPSVDCLYINGKISEIEALLEIIKRLESSDD